MRTLFLLGSWIAVSLAHAEVVSVEVENLGQLISKGIPLVDVRTPSEWQQTGVVSGSHTLTYFDDSGAVDRARWMKDFSKVAGPDQEVAIICRSGARSRIVAEFLDQQQHYRKVYTIEGGVIGWKALGNPTVRP